MTKVSGRTIDPACEITLALYQAITGPRKTKKRLNKSHQISSIWIVIDECHAAAHPKDSAREISITSVPPPKLTATPKETHEVSSTDYFGDPVYVYSLKEGIEDGFSPLIKLSVLILMLICALAPNQRAN